MLRLALTYQLILAVEVGPLLCCCSAGKLLAGPPRSPNSGPSSGQVPVRSSASAPHSCCSHKHQPSSSDRESHPSKPGAPADKCPCKDGSDSARTTQVESVHADVSSFLRLLTFETFAPFHVPSACLLVSAPAAGCDAGRGTDRHSLTTAVLLYAHHNLRC